MDYIAKAQDSIKKEWFENHVASLSGEVGLQVISWAQPGTYSYRINYVLSDENIFISGDAGEAVYSLSSLATFQEISKMDLFEFTRNLRAFSNDRWRFDKDYAKQELHEFWKEHNVDEKYPDSGKLKETLLYVIDECESVDAYRSWLFSVYQDSSLDTFDFEYIWDFGQRMPNALIGYWLGLKMAIQQITNQRETKIKEEMK